MKIEIKAVPVFVLHLSGEQARVLQKWARAHYDGVCKAAGNQGGFIYGWVNQTTYSGEPTSACRATWREADTLLKIGEIGPGIPDDEAATMRAVSTLLRKAMDKSRVLDDALIEVEDQP